MLEKTKNKGSLILIISVHLLLSVLGLKQGFINIDCGKTFSYDDPKTGLHFVPDSEYIDSGENRQVISNLRDKADYPQANDLRSFPNGTRNCYTLRPVVKGNKYLLRAFFMYGNYDGKDSLPKFDLYFGANLWFHVKIINSSVNFYTEIIAVAPANSISVCLKNTNDGIPFISTLELRPLSHFLYKEVDTFNSLILQTPRDCGEAKRTSKIRYPDDSYDRLWVPYDPYIWSHIETNNEIITNTNGGYQVPSEIMKTAAIPKDGGTKIDFNWTASFKWTEYGVGPAEYYIFLHFAELLPSSGNNSRIFDVKFNDEIIGSNVTPEYLSITTISNKIPKRYEKLMVSIYSVNGSTLPPILNALEIYAAKPIRENDTNSQDVDAIFDIKYEYQVKKNWMGDPCIPSELIWKDLRCATVVGKPPRIISLNLSFSQLNGKLADSIANLSQLEYLDLSVNNLRGEIPNFLASLRYLKSLNLTGSGLEGPIPKALLEKSEKGLLTLSFDQYQKPAKSPKTVIIIVTSICSAFFLLLMVLIYARRKKKQGYWMNQRNDSELTFDSRKFSYQELVSITHNFSKQLGRGGFGIVYHGVLDNGNEVAIKVLSKLSSQGPKEFQNEAQLLTRIHHRNLVPLVGYCYDKDHVALVYECMEEGTLESHLSGRASVLSWRKRLQIVVDAAQGLEYLHKGCKPAIIHRDVKTSNILLNKNMEARISDFGLSKIIQNDNITHVTTMVMGTPGYLDPEYYITNQLNEKSDVYSFGVVLLEVITGKPAIVKIQEPTHIIECVQAGIEQGDLNMIVDPKFEEAYDANSVWKAIKIALSCTSNRSLHRITMTQVVTLLKECLDLETDIDDDINLESRTTTTSYATSTGDSNANSTVSMVH